MPARIFRRRVRSNDRGTLPHGLYPRGRELYLAELVVRMTAEGDARTVAEFLGLRELNVIHDALEHGAELSYTEDIGLTNDAASALVRPKDELGGFAAISPSGGPDYASGEIMAAVDR